MIVVCSTMLSIKANNYQPLNKKCAIAAVIHSNLHKTFNAESVFCWLSGISVLGYEIISPYGTYF